MSLDNELRTMFRRRAEAHVSRPDLMTAVRQRERKHQQRRRVVASAFAAVVVAVTVPVAVTVRSGPTVEAAAVGLAAPGPAATFPLTPTWEPDWVGRRSFTFVRTATGPQAELRYETTFPFGAAISVEISGHSPGVQGETLEVGGHAATLSTTDAGAQLAWRASGGWALVRINNRVSRDELFHYVSSLDERPLPMTMPFTVALVPEDGGLSSFDRHSLVYTKIGTSDVMLVITLEPTASATGQQTTVDDESIITADGPGVVLAYRAIDSDRVVRVSVSTGWNLSTDQVAEIARGVGATSVALTTGG